MSNPQRPVRPAIHSTRRARPDAQPNAFQGVMASQFQDNAEQLNQEYQRLLQSLPDAPTRPVAEMPESPDLMIHCEYQRLMEENNYLYGLRTGKVYAFGRDDAMQMGQPSHADLEDDQKPDTFGPLLVNIMSSDNATVTGTIRQISAGSQHCVVLTDEGEPITWYVTLEHDRSVSLSFFLATTTHYSRLFFYQGHGRPGHFGSRSRNSLVGSDADASNDIHDG